MTMIRAMVRFTILYVNENRSARWEKSMIFPREPYEKEHVELWSGGPSLPIVGSMWACGGDLVLFLASVPTGRGLGSDGDRDREKLRRLRQYEPNGPSAEDLRRDGWEETEA